MGGCNCVKKNYERSELHFNFDRAKEIESIIFKNPKLFCTLKRIQARLRGLITRTKVKAAYPDLNINLLNKGNSTTNYKRLAQPKLVNNF